MQMASAALQEFAEVDSGFFVYRKRFNAFEEQTRATKANVFAPWGVFENEPPKLQRLLDRSVQDLNLLLPFMERWFLAEDLPSLRLREEWGRYPLLEIGLWPLTSRDQIVGLIVATRTKPVSHRLTSEMSLAILDACAAQLSVAFNLILAARIVEQASQLDLLTRVLNRRGLEHRISGRVHDSQASGKSLVLGAIDLDNLKTINDTHGHPVGDEALRQVAEIITKSLQPKDLVCRYGGDEFVVAFLWDSQDAAQAMRRLQQAVLDHSDGYSISVGGAVWGLDGNTLEECYRIADARLYVQKLQKRT